MQLIELELKEYLETLKSATPAPGGGSVSALAGAQGVALFLMVADFTLGKEKFAEYEEVCRLAKERGEELLQELIKSIDDDTEAFNLVAAGFKMPKDTDEQKAARSKAIREGTLVSTKVPYRVMEISLEGLKIARSLSGRSNPNAGSDLGVAVLNLMAAIKGAWFNVKINLSGLKDEEKEKYYREGGERILREGEAIAKQTLDEVQESL